MHSKMFLVSFFLLFSSPVSLGLSPNLDQQGGGGGGGIRDDSVPCLQKLMPCQPYLKSVSRPPSTCCTPLKEVVLNDSECLCKIFNNISLLGRFNITQGDALKLPKVCRAIIDLPFCEQVAYLSGSPATPSNGSSASNSTNIKSAADWNLPLGGSSFIALLAVNLGLIFQSIQELC